MPEKKTKGSKVLEEALKESCESSSDRYPCYEGEIDLGEDYARYEKRLLRRAKASPSKYGGRISVLAASFILFFACSMAAIWLSVIFYDRPGTPPDHPTSGSESATKSTWASVETTPGTRPMQSGSSGTTCESTTDANNSASLSVAPSVGTEVPDEKSAVRTVSADNANGLKMEVTVHGYQSEGLNQDFYVKNNEYFLVDVKVTNTSDSARWQWLSTYCRNSDPAHNHEIGFELVSGEYKLNSSSFGFACGALIDVWELKPGATYEWQLKLAAGEVKSGGNYDLPVDGDGYLTGIDLYGNDIYIDGVCTFAGEFYFDYKTSDQEHFNDFSLSVPISVDVVFISSDT